MNLNFPTPLHSSTASGFFNEFMDVNKKVEGFTHRKVAQMLEWPQSYISDVCAERKDLTCSRALQFSAFAKFDPFDTEKLVYLALKNGFEGTRVPTKTLESAFFGILEGRERGTENSDLVYDNVCVVVFNYLRWQKKLHPIDIIQRGLYTYKFTSEEIERAISVLKKREIIKVNEDRSIEFSQKHITVEEANEYGDGKPPGIHLHLDYAESFKEWCKNPKPPAIYTTNMLVLEQKRYLEFENKFKVLKKWLYQVSEESMEKPAKDLALFQVDMNIFPMAIRPERLQEQDELQD